MTYRIPYECICCGGCMERCPTHAISPRNGYYEIDPARCIDCGVCLETCPYDLPHPMGEVPVADPREHRLRTFVIDPDACIGCSACSRACPVGAAFGEVRQPFSIDQDLCIGCGLCERRCRKGAIRPVGDAAPDQPYSIDPDACISCDQCRKHCPAHAISGHLVPKFVIDWNGIYRVPYQIDPETCTRCGICTTWCAEGAIALADEATRAARADAVAAKEAAMPTMPTEHATGVI